MAASLCAVMQPLHLFGFHSALRATPVPGNARALPVRALGLGASSVWDVRWLERRLPP